MFVFAVTIDSKIFDFHSFLITVERDCGGGVDEDCGDPMSPDRSGSLQLLSQDNGATFHPECINTIVQSEPAAKMRKLRFMWSAPKAGSGCVYIRLISCCSYKTDFGTFRCILMYRRG
jgi:hypothetical protein